MEIDIAIQHRNIPEAELHEPKGASLAQAGTVYSANGQGSGSWRKVNTEMLDGLGPQSGQTNLTVLTNGLGGFRYTTWAAYGTLAINNNSVGFAVTDAVDSTLNTNTDYKLITGTGAPWVPDLDFEVTVGPDSLTVTQDGVYRVDTWMDIVSFPTMAAKLAVKYVINGNQYSLRKISVKSNSGGDAGNLSGFGLVQLAAGDTIRLAVASTEAGDIVFESGNFSITLIRAT